MSDHLIRQIRYYLETNPTETAAGIEQRAQIPPATLAHLLRGSRPKPERMAKLLTAVDRDTANHWLHAYILDTIPDEHLHHINLSVDLPGGSLIREQPALYNSARDRLSIAIDHLRQLASRDDDLAQWIIDTAHLFGLHIPSREVIPAASVTYTDDEKELIRQAKAIERKQRKP